MPAKKVITPNDKALITKHNKLIQAKYTLTLQEKRLVYWLISEIRPHDQDFKRYRVAVKELAAFLGLENNHRLYQQVAQVTARLLRRVMQIEEPQNKTLLQVAWISSAHYHLGKGYVDLSFDPQLKPYLVQLKSHFTSIELRYALHLQSIYAMRLYELLKQYQKIGQRQLAVGELRELLGIEPHKYKYIKDFRRYVLEIAQREINAKTDLRFDFEEIKEGRKIAHLRFCIASQQPVAETGTVPATLPEEDKLCARLEAFGVASAEAARLLSDFDPERIQWHLEELQRRLKAKRTITNPAAWLVQGIREDYRPQPSLLHQQRVQAQAATHASDQRREEISSLLEQLDKEYRKYLLPTIEAFVGALRAKSAAEHAFVCQEFANTLTSDFARERFQEHGFSEPMVFKAAAAFFCARYPQAFSSKAAFARQHRLPDPDQLSAELMELAPPARVAA